MKISTISCIFSQGMLLDNCEKIKYKYITNNESAKYIFGNNVLETLISTTSNKLNNYMMTTYVYVLYTNVLVVSLKNS